MERKEYNFIYWIKAVSMLLIIFTHHNFSDQQRLMFMFPFYVDMAVPLLVLCTGFLNENSYIYKLGGVPKKWYELQNINRKMAPIVIPYVFFICIEVIYNLIQGLANYRGILYGVLTGGWGQGSYYIPIIIQIYLLFPVISWIGKDKIRILVSFITVVAYCFLCTYFSFSDSLYKIIAIRYIPFASLGCYIYNRQLKPSTYITGGLISFGFIVLLNYTYYKPVVFSQWTTTSLPVIGWATFLWFLFSKIRSCPSLIKLIANSSFFIFLTQKTYLYIFSNLKAVRYFLFNIIVIIVLGVFLHKLYNKYIGKSTIVAVERCLKKK